MQRGVAGGFTQANHGKNTGLKWLSRDDWIVFYSPKEDYEGNVPLQAFTAIGQIADDEPYRFEMTPDFIPWRRNVTFYDCDEAPIRPMIYGLNFIQDKTHWGYKFRFGLFEISESDFMLIKQRIIKS